MVAFYKLFCEVMLDYGGVLGWFMQSPFDYYARAITQSKASFGLVGTDEYVLRVYRIKFVENAVMDR